MFRASSAYLQENTVVHVQHMALSLSMRVLGGPSVHNSASSAHLQEDTVVHMQHMVVTLYESDSTICCTCTTVSS